MQPLARGDKSLCSHTDSCESSSTLLYTQKFAGRMYLHTCMYGRAVLCWLEKLRAESLGYDDDSAVPERVWRTAFLGWSTTKTTHPLGPFSQSRATLSARNPPILFFFPIPNSPTLQTLTTSFLIALYYLPVAFLASIFIRIYTLDYDLTTPTINTRNNVYSSSECWHQGHGNLLSQPGQLSRP